VTKARAKCNNHDKLASATFGKIAYAKCLEKIKQSMCYFGLARFVALRLLRNTTLPVSKSLSKKRIN